MRTQPGLDLIQTYRMPQTAWKPVLEIACERVRRWFSFEIPYTLCLYIWSIWTRALRFLIASLFFFYFSITFFLLAIKWFGYGLLRQALGYRLLHTIPLHLTLGQRSGCRLVCDGFLSWIMSCVRLWPTVSIFPFFSSYYYLHGYLIFAFFSLWNGHACNILPSIWFFFTPCLVPYNILGCLVKPCPLLLSFWLYCLFYFLCSYPLSFFFFIFSFSAFSLSHSLWRYWWVTWFFDFKKSICDYLDYLLLISFLAWKWLLYEFTYTTYS